MMASYIALIQLFVIIALASGEIVRNERGLADLASEGIGGAFGVGLDALSAESVRRECISRGYYNVNVRHRRGLINVLGDATVGGLATAGNFLLTKETVKAGCTAAGYYDERLENYYGFKNAVSSVEFPI